jgi:hypothetical protein
MVFSKINLRELEEIQADPFCELLFNTAEKFDQHPHEFNQILKGFGIKLEIKFIYEINRFGIHVLGKENKNAEWNEYYLDFGQELKTELELKDFFLKFY